MEKILDSLARLNGITYTNAAGSTIELNDFFRRYEIRESPANVDDGTRHSLYNRSRAKIRPRSGSTKPVPVYTKEYKGSEIFNYILEMTGTEFKRIFLEEYTPHEQEMIQETLALYTKNIWKNKGVSSSDIKYQTQEMQKKLELLFACNVLSKEVDRHDTSKWKYIRGEHVKSEDAVLQCLIRNAKSVFEKVHTTPIEKPGLPFELIRLNQGWFAFNGLFPNLGFDTYLRMTHRDREKYKTITRSIRA